MGTCIGGSKKSCAFGSGGALPDCCAGSSDAFSLHPLKAATSASANTLRTTVLLIDVSSPGCALHSNDNVANGQENDGADREPQASRNYRIGIAAVHERVDDSHDYRKQVEPEVQLVRAGRGPPGSDPDLRQVDQARHHSEQQAKDDEPGGAFVPKHHGSLGIDDVEDQSSDEAAEWDRIEKAIDALGNDGATGFGTKAHGAATSLSIGLRKGRHRTLPYVSLQVRVLYKMIKDKSSPANWRHTSSARNLPTYVEPSPLGQTPIAGFLMLEPLGLVAVRDRFA